MKHVCITGLILLSFLFSTTACKTKEAILSHLDESSANEIVVMLQDNQIKAHKIEIKERKGSSFSIWVFEKETPRAMRLLVYNHLPKKERAGFKEVYPPGSSGLIPTKSDENARYTMALEGEIEGLIKVLPGVREARVALSLPDESSFKSLDQKALKRASAAIIYSPKVDSSLPSFSKEDIQQLIASAVVDLSAADVTVLMKPNEKVQYLGIDSDPKESPSPHAAKNNEQKKPLPFGLLGFLMVCTFLGLSLGFYGMFRFRNLKKKMKSASTIPLVSPQNQAGA